MSITTVMSGYGPLDDADECGIEEALIMAEVAHQEARIDAAEVFGRIARRPGEIDLSAHDLDGLTPVFGDLSAVD